MDAAKQLAPNETEPLTWAEIGRRYTDQYVCLVDVVHPRRGDPDVSARVVGNGATHDVAFEPIHDLDEQYPRFSVRFTGESTIPLIRPAFGFDDEDLKLPQSSRELILVDAGVIGHSGRTTQARLVVDTGSAATTLTPGVVERIGYGRKDAFKDATVTTAIGEERGYWLNVAQLDVLGIVTPNFAVTMFPLGHQNLDGLVGMNFLRHFNFEIRSAEQTIHLELIQP